MRESATTIPNNQTQHKRKKDKKQTNKERTPIKKKRWSILPLAKVWLPDLPFRSVVFNGTCTGVAANLSWLYVVIIKEVQSWNVYSWSQFANLSWLYVVIINLPSCLFVFMSFSFEYGSQFALKFGFSKEKVIMRKGMKGKN